MPPRLYLQAPVRSLARKLAWLCVATGCALTGWSADGPAAAITPQTSEKARSITDLKQPIGWFSWGLDLRVRQEVTQNSPSTPSAPPDLDSSYLRIRPRVWTTVNPVTNTSWNMRLISEPRYFFEPSSQRGWAGQEGLLDLFNFQVTNLLSQPAGLIVGRQEFNFGDRRLIFDGSQADGSRTEFFDAARLTLSPESLHTTFDAIYICGDAETDAWLPVINQQNEFVSEQDEQSGILYARNRSLGNTQLDAYLIYRHEEPASSRGNQGDLWATGIRADGALGGAWRYKAEMTPQWGRLNGRALQAFGANSQVSLDAGGAWRHRLRAGYEYLSGDDPDTGVDEGWDPFWARRAQWSELMVFRFAQEYGGRPADYKNLHRLSVGWTANPARNFEISLDYMPLFAPEPPPPGNAAFNSDGSFRGHYLAWLNTLRLNAHWTALVRAEFFQPGDYYAEPYRKFSLFARAEIYFRF